MVAEVREEPISKETLKATREAPPGELIEVVCRLRRQNPLSILFELLSRVDQFNKPEKVIRYFPLLSSRPSSARVFPSRNPLRGTGRLR